MLQDFKQLLLEVHVHCPSSLYKSGSRHKTFGELKLGDFRSLKAKLFICGEGLKKPTKNNVVLQEIITGSHYV